MRVGAFGLLALWAVSLSARSDFSSVLEATGPSAIRVLAMLPLADGQTIVMGAGVTHFLLDGDASTPAFRGSFGYDPGYTFGSAEQTNSGSFWQLGPTRFPEFGGLPNQGLQFELDRANRVLYQNATRERRFPRDGDVFAYSSEFGPGVVRRFRRGVQLSSRPLQGCPGASSQCSFSRHGVLANEGGGWMARSQFIASENAWATDLMRFDAEGNALQSFPLHRTRTVQRVASEVWRDNAGLRVRVRRNDDNSSALFNIADGALPTVQASGTIPSRATVCSDERVLPMQNGDWLRICSSPAGWWLERYTLRANQLEPELRFRRDFPSFVEHHQNSPAGAILAWSRGLVWLNVDGNPVADLRDYSFAHFDQEEVIATRIVSTGTEAVRFAADGTPLGPPERFGDLRLSARISSIHQSPTGRLVAAFQIASADPQLVHFVSVNDDGSLAPFPTSAPVYASELSWGNPGPRSDVAYFRSTEPSAVQRLDLTTGQVTRFTVCVRERYCGNAPVWTLARGFLVRQVHPDALELYDDDGALRDSLELGDAAEILALPSTDRLGVVVERRGNRRVDWHEITSELRFRKVRTVVPLAEEIFFSARPASDGGLLIDGTLSHRYDRNGELKWLLPDIGREIPSSRGGNWLLLHGGVAYRGPNGALSQPMSVIEGSVAVHESGDLLIHGGDNLARVRAHPGGQLTVALRAVPVVGYSSSTLPVVGSRWLHADGRVNSVTLPESIPFGAALLMDGFEAWE